MSDDSDRKQSDPSGGDGQGSKPARGGDRRHGGRRDDDDSPPKEGADADAASGTGAKQSGKDGAKDIGKGGGKDKADDKADQKDDGKPPLYKRPLVVLLVLALLLAAIIAGIVFWRSSQHHATTDDAFIDGRASAIATQAAGRVLKLYITDNQVVHAGDPLLDIDARDVDARVEQSRAQLSSAESQLQQARAQVGLQRANVAQARATTAQSVAQHVQAEQDLARYAVVDPEAVSRQQADSAAASALESSARVQAGRSGERAAQAQVKAALASVAAAAASVTTAQANLASAELQVAYTHLVAPVGGRIARRAVEAGNVVAVGQTLMTIVDPVMWVTANFKETQLNKMRRGMAVDIKIDAYPDVTFQGRIDSIQAGTGSYFSLLPAENATGNYVKVVQRVPVKIVFDDDRIANYAIGPGMSVAPEVQLP